jgi:hypothetical protein
VLNTPVTVGRALRLEVVVEAGRLTDDDAGRGIETGADESLAGLVILGVFVVVVVVEIEVDCGRSKLERYMKVDILCPEYLL